MSIRKCVIVLIVLNATQTSAQPENPEARNTQLARQLIEIIRDDSGRTCLAARVQAAKTLGEMGFDARVVIPEIISLLSDPHRHYPELLADAIVRAVGRIGAPARVAIPTLIRQSGTDRDLDRTIAEVVRQILQSPNGPADLLAMTRQLKAPDASQRLIAAKNLATLGPSARPAGAALTEALTDPDGDVRRMAFQAMVAIFPGSNPPEAAVGALVKDLQDNDEGIRFRAVKSLGRFGPAAVGAVVNLQAVSRTDPDPDVRRAAAEALTRIQQR